MSREENDAMIARQAARVAQRDAAEAAAKAAAAPAQKPKRAGTDKPRKAIPMHAMIPQRIMKGSAFREYPHAGFATYDAHWAAVAKQVNDDFKQLPDAEFRAKYALYID